MFHSKIQFICIFFIHYSSIISNLCCFGFQEQAKYWDVYPANVPSAIISDLEPGVEYSIDVMSINNMGESNFTLDPVIVRTSSKKIMLIFPVSTMHFKIAMGLKTFWSNMFCFGLNFLLFPPDYLSLEKLTHTKSGAILQKFNSNFEGTRENFKVRTFLETHKIWKKSSSWFCQISWFT